MYIRGILLSTLIGFFGVASSVRADEAPAAPSASDAKFSNESEAGVVLSTGNSNIRAFNFKQMNAYEWTGNVLKFEGRYLGSSNSGTENARFLTLGLRYERLLVDRFSLFAAETYQSDIFAGYDRRFNTDLGVKYLLIKETDTDWFVEAGYRHIAEKLVSGTTSNRSNLRVYTEAMHKLQKNISLKLWVEYIQSVESTKDLLLNSEISASVLLSEVFSLKLGYLLRFNNNPLAPKQRADTTFTTALVAKF